MSKLEGPIKKVDQIFCTGLDYVETNVPGVKLPPGEVNQSNVILFFLLIILTTS